MGALYYDREGNPLTDVLEFARLFEDTEYKRVAVTEINSEILVSTVWLGLDHGWGSNVPIIFETMVFGGPLDQEQWRYPSEEAALAGHDQAVAAVREALGTLADPP